MWIILPVGVYKKYVKSASGLLPTIRKLGIRLYIDARRLGYDFEKSDAFRLLTENGDLIAALAFVYEDIETLREVLVRLPEDCSIIPGRDDRDNTPFEQVRIKVSEMLGGTEGKEVLE